MAASVWWCVISLTWFLAAGLKWGSEAVANYRAQFHFVAWSLPLVQTLVVLSQSLVDADSLTGFCGVGNTRTASLRLYKLLPSTVYLLIGATFLVAGFVALFKLRRSLIRNKQRRSHKLEKLMIRIGIFSILFTVPASCVIICEYYESLYRLEWERAVICQAPTTANEAMCASFDKKDRKPEFWVFILKVNRKIQKDLFILNNYKKFILLTIVLHEHGNRRDIRLLDLEQQEFEFVACIFKQRMEWSRIKAHAQLVRMHTRDRVYLVSDH